MSKPPRHPGLDNRSRDKSGEIRRKNSNTLVRTLRSIPPRSVSIVKASAVSPPGFLNADYRFGFANCNP